MCKVRMYMIARWISLTLFSIYRHPGPVSEQESTPRLNLLKARSWRAKWERRIDRTLDKRENRREKRDLSCCRATRRSGVTCRWS